MVGLALLDDDPAHDEAHDPAAFEVLGDTAYGTGDARAALTEAGHTAVIKPGPLRPAVAGGFTLDDFTVDETAGTVTCPNGVTRRHHRRPQRRLRRRLPRLSATAALHHRQRRPQPALHPRTRRACCAQPATTWATDDDLRATYRRHRPMVERSIAWLIGPKGRCRKLRYRGVAANNWWLHTRMAALNLRRLLNLGLHHDHRTWSITPAAA